MDFLFALHDALPWYLQLTGSSRLYEMLADWAADRGIIRGDDWTQIFLWLYQWLAIGALMWGVGAGLLVTRRSPSGRFRGDPEKHRDAVVTGALHAAAAAAVAAGFVLVLFLATVVGPGPIIWAAAAYLAVRLGRALRRRLQQRPAPRPALPSTRGKRGQRAGV